MVLMAVIRWPCSGDMSMTVVQLPVGEAEWVCVCSAKMGLEWLQTVPSFTVLLLEKILSAG